MTTTSHQNWHQHSLYLTTLVDPMLCYGLWYTVGMDLMAVSFIISATPPLYILKPTRSSVDVVWSCSGKVLESPESGGRGSNWNIYGQSVLILAWVGQHYTIWWPFVKLTWSLIGLLHRLYFIPMRLLIIRTRCCFMVKPLVSLRKHLTVTIQQ